MKYDMSLVECLRPLTKQEYEDLEDNCIESGILDSIKVWNGFLVDGRHRVKIADKHGLRVDEKEMEFASIDEAKCWVIQNQIGKRNITDSEASKLRAEMAKLMSIRDVAVACKVSPRTVFSDVQASKGASKASSDIAEKCASGEIINSKADWLRFSELEPAERTAVEHKLRTSPGITLRDALPPKKKQEVRVDSINDNKHISSKAKRDIASGRVSIDSESVKQLNALPAESQELLSTILEDEEVTSLSQGLLILEGAIQPRTQEESVRNIMLSIEKLVERIDERLNDLEVVGVGAKSARKLLLAFRADVRGCCNE
jgi:hypothetical protein